LSTSLRDIVSGRGRLVVNGRADVAFASRADGVHLPADGLPPTGARQALGPDALVGLSVHSVDEVAASASEPIDYLMLGTIFPSPSHPGGQLTGLEGVRRAAGLPIPMVGVGGITAENAVDIIEAGAQGVAVISAIFSASEPREAALRLSDAVREAWTRRTAAVDAG